MARTFWSSLLASVLEESSTADQAAAQYETNQITKKRKRNKRMQVNESIAAARQNDDDDEAKNDDVDDKNKDMKKKSKPKAPPVPVKPNQKAALIRPSDVLWNQRVQSAWDRHNTTTRHNKTLLPALADERDQRFPSVAERVRVYLGPWWSDRDEDATTNSCGGSGGSSGPDDSPTTPPPRRSTAISYQYNWTDPNEPVVTLRLVVTVEEEATPSTTTTTTTTPTPPIVWQRSLLSRPLDQDPTSLFFAAAAATPQAQWDDCDALSSKTIPKLYQYCQDLRGAIPRSMLVSFSSFVSKQQPQPRPEHNTSQSLQPPPPPPPILLTTTDRSSLEAVPFLHKCRTSMYSYQNNYHYLKLTNNGGEVEGSVREDKTVGANDKCLPTIVAAPPTEWISRSAPFSNGTHTPGPTKLSPPILDARSRRRRRRHILLRQPILWNLNSKRHFGLLSQVAQSDSEWHDKLNAAVFRGAMTGRPSAKDWALRLGYSDPERYRHEFWHGYQQHDEQHNDTAKCLLIPRCHLVFRYADSPLLNVGLTDRDGPVWQFLDNPTNVSGVNLLGNPLTLSELLSYKMILVLDGNDLPSGIKWALLSRSVVLMPRLSYTSYGMEELLQPFVHYVPIHPDLSNVETMVQWVLDHDDEAQRIAHQGSLWIQDLVFHPKAKRDQELIQQQVLQRYAALFTPYLDDDDDGA
ncbi:hypothetical protein ACA910_019485 [Epithemia clementina (nom. ined.)]